jgi:phosphoglycerate dehydrogenase-like enzyme
MKLVIAIPHRFALWDAPPWFSERLRREFPELEVAHLDNYSTLEREIADADIVLARSLKAEQVRAAKKLKWIYSAAAAIHSLMIPEIVKSDVVVTNASWVHGPVVAEHAMAMILAIGRRIDLAVKAQTRHQWTQEEIWTSLPGPRDIAGSTLIVVGLGHIGTPLVRHAKALGMRVFAVREHTERGREGADAVYATRDLPRILPEADFVLLCAPVTPATQHAFGREQFVAMKKDAYILNVGRGALIDEPALIEALREHRIGGAALDVTTEEPLPADSPLWDLDNCMITPHTAGISPKLWERQYTYFADNLRRFLAGKPLHGLVDKSRGY